VVKAADADSAQVRVYLMQTRNTGENVQVISTGVYTFVLRRSDSGWRIAELILAHVRVLCCSRSLSQAIAGPA
jgi:hypothetical protein